MADIVLVKADDELHGKRPAEIAGIIKQLIEEGAGEPVPWVDLCAGVGIKESARRASMMLAMHALELCGIVERYSYVEEGETRSRPAYALSEHVEIEGELT
jgi:hypothetical protein